MQKKINVNGSTHTQYTYTVLMKLRIEQTTRVKAK